MCINIILHFHQQYEYSDFFACLPAFDIVTFFILAILLSVWYSPRNTSPALSPLCLHIDGRSVLFKRGSDHSTDSSAGLQTILCSLNLQPPAIFSEHHSDYGILLPLTLLYVSSLTEWHSHCMAQKALHRQPFTYLSSCYFFHFLSPFSPTGYAPKPLLPIPIGIFAIARTFYAPSQLCFSSHVDLCSHLQAKEHFFFITVVFHTEFQVFLCVKQTHCLLFSHCNLLDRNGVSLMFVSFAQSCAQ